MRGFPPKQLSIFPLTGFTTQEPPADDSVIAMDQPDHPARCDKAGRFRLHPKRGWHAAYCIGPICESLLPGWDVTYPGRSIQVSAPGYATADFRVSAFARGGTNAVAGDLAGAWLRCDSNALLFRDADDSARCLDAHQLPNR